MRRLTGDDRAKILRMFFEDGGLSTAVDCGKDGLGRCQATIRAICRGENERRRASS